MNYTQRIREISGDPSFLFTKDMYHEYKNSIVGDIVRNPYSDLSEDDISRFRVFMVEHEGITITDMPDNYDQQCEVEDGMETFLTPEQVKDIQYGWLAFFESPSTYTKTKVPEMVRLDLEISETSRKRYGPNYVDFEVDVVNDPDFQEEEETPSDEQKSFDMQELVVEKSEHGSKKQSTGDILKDASAF